MSGTRKWVARLGAVMSAAALVPVTGVGTAHASHGNFTVDLAVAANGGATMTVADGISHLNYLVTLTAEGAGTCGLMGPAVEIVDFGVATNTTSTQGACNIYNGTVNYVLTWTAVGGVAGQWTVQCTWDLLTSRICTPTHAEGTLVSGLINSL